MMIRVINWLAPLGLAFLLAACRPADDAAIQLHLTGNTMGTYYSVKVVGAGDSQAEVLQAEIDRRLELVNDQMSTYREHSELSRFNQYRDLAPFKVSSDTAKVVTAALQLGRDSNDALDVTVGPLVNLWGFGPDARPTHIPTDEQLAETKAETGLAYLSVITRADGDYLQKSLPGLYVDLSSIAKGFGVDVVSEYLSEQGLTNHLVEIGGEVRTSGLNAHGQDWRIAVEKPGQGESMVQQVVALANTSVATSGDYRNYYELDGERVSHTIDPATGKPITHRLASVTVIHPSCMMADALATALTVMGTDKALAYAEQNGLAVYLLTKTDAGFRVDMSSAFEKYLRG